MTAALLKYLYLLFVLKQKVAKSSRKSDASTHKLAHPRLIFRPSLFSLRLIKITTSIQDNNSKIICAKRLTENSASTAVCLSKVEERDGASFRSQVLLVTFVTTKVTRKNVQGLYMKITNILALNIKYYEIKNCKSMQ